MIASAELPGDQFRVLRTCYEWHYVGRESGKSGKLVSHEVVPAFIIRGELADSGIDAETTLRLLTDKGLLEPYNTPVYLHCPKGWKLRDGHTLLVRYEDIPSNKAYCFAVVEIDGREVTRDLSRSGKDAAWRAYRLTKAGIAVIESDDGTPADPVKLAWLRTVVPQRTVKGDSTKLTNWLRHREVRVFKIANRNCAKRADLLDAFKNHPKVRQVIEEHTADFD